MAKHARCMNMRCKHFGSGGWRHKVKKKTCVCGGALKYPRSKKGQS